MKHALATATLFLATAIPLATSPLAIMPVRAAEPPIPQPVDFSRKIAPLIEQHCLGCHNDRDRRGGLSLVSAQQALQGGESGPVIVPGDPTSSYLLDLLEPVDGKAEMPQAAKPLAAESRELIREWIRQGAPWPTDVVLKPTVWWSLQPLSRPTVPPLSPELAQWGRTPIDNFVAARQRLVGVKPAPVADRRTLVRRVYFDLIGLPPTPEEMRRSVNDRDPRWFENLVDELLASPRYGERWARHWLDLVHYGETHGYDKDKPRNTAWPYRDYVIRAFNTDKPYGRFVEEQIAGDVLYPNTLDGNVALGFIAAGPWDYIGHVEVPESKFDGQVARHLDRDDMVQNATMSFLSLTVGCAQCHDHKFDPILQTDYYALQAVFAALDRADRSFDTDPQVAAERERLTKAIASLETRQSELQRKLHEAAGRRLAEIDRQLDELAKNSKETFPAEHGYHSRIESTADSMKWVQVDLGQPVRIDRIELVACHDNYNHIGAGFGFPLRYRVEVCDDPEFQDGVVVIADRSQADVPNPGIAPQLIAGDQSVGRFVRVTATRLAPRSNDYIFAISELKVFDREGDNVAAGQPVTALDSIEAAIRWGRANLVDGLYPQSVGADDRTRLQAERAELLKPKHVADIVAKAASLDTELKQLSDQRDRLPSQQVVYAGTVHTGKGNFRGTGPDNGVPRTIHLAKRGNLRDLGPIIAPATVDCVVGLSGDLHLPAIHTEGDRRAAFARWMTDRANSLTWRSIVNRIWLHHFGRGIVETPNDFGRMGQLPTHPALLDWLAVELRDGEQSIKHLHRLIVNSAVYRQSSVGDRAHVQVDADNHFYWRQNRRRLDAESVRDAVLQVSGKLDLTMGGPSFQDFVIDKPAHSPHYEYRLHDPNDPKSHRRSIYRFIVRSQTQPFMTVMDCADPSIMVAKRNQTITPLQALAMLNNQLMLAMSQHFANHVQASGSTTEEHVARAFQLALQRDPIPEELTALSGYAEQHGLVNACRAILNLNEFLFVD